ncbi:MAG: hypothetical protein SGPRY_010179, partial [Prymnesium sp.]
VLHRVLMDSDVVAFTSAPREGDVGRSMVAMGGGAYHLPAGAVIRLISVDDKFRTSCK